MSGHSEMTATTRVHQLQIKVNNQLIMTASNRSSVSLGSSNAVMPHLQTSEKKTINQQQ